MYVLLCLVCAFGIFGQYHPVPLPLEDDGSVPAQNDLSLATVSPAFVPFKFNWVSTVTHVYLFVQGKIHNSMRDFLSSSILSVKYFISNWCVLFNQSIHAYMS